MPICSLETIIVHNLLKQALGMFLRMKMPRCGKCKSENSKFLKEWNYNNNYYTVKQYKCMNCRKTFSEYFHEGKIVFTIQRIKQKKFKV
jgi:hypothetical protein